MSTNGRGPLRLGEALPGPIQLVHYFNGRLLSAEDMQREQDANRDSRLRLGRALGDGVVSGFEVSETRGFSTPAQPVVTVRAGLAFNRLGAAVEMTVDHDLSLVKMGAGTTNGAVQSTGDFAACGALVPGAYFTEAGVYLLTVAPVEQLVGRAPTNGLGNALAPCNSDYSVEGVTFELLHLNVSQTSAGNLLTDPARLRNRLAHLMFGTFDPRRQAVEVDPFGTATTQYGFLDDLRPLCLRDDQVPLAVLYWTPGLGIVFVDRWSVRRHLTRGSADTDWPVLVSERRRAEGEAMFLQFQEQLEELQTAGAPELAQAVATFTYLPPGGFLPLAASSLSGYSYRAFFTGVTTRGPVFFEGARLESLVSESLTYSPIDLVTGEAIWLYEVRENLQPGGPTQNARPFIMFSSGHIPYRGDARFNLAYWNYSNVARVG